MFVLIMNTGNAAFYDEELNIDRTSITSCLKNVVYQIEMTSQTTGSILDYNGNRVGEWKLTP